MSWPRKVEDLSTQDPFRDFAVGGAAGSSLGCHAKSASLPCRRAKRRYLRRWKSV